MLSPGLGLGFKPPRGHFIVVLLLRSMILVLVVQVSGLGLALAQWPCLHVTEVNSDAVSNKCRLKTCNLACTDLLMNLITYQKLYQYFTGQKCPPNKEDVNGMFKPAEPHSPRNAC